jgi:CheY-like chemotaxis protein
MVVPAVLPPQILVVEDDIAHRELFQDVLAELGYRCLTASSLDRALCLVHQQPVDLIVSDCFSSTFQQALASLRPLRELAYPVPLVVCTAWPVTDTDVREQGFAGLLPKPFTLDQLVTTVSDRLNQPFSEEQLRQAEVARRYVAALNRWDFDGLIALLTEDIQYYPWVVSAFPATYPWRGHTAGRTFYQEARRYFGDWQADVVQLYPVPNGVATRLLLRWHAPNGAVRQQMQCFFFQFSDEGTIRQVGIPLLEQRDPHLVEENQAG